MSQETSPPQDVYRQFLGVAVAAICLECGYDSVEKSAMETLTEILQSYLTEAGRSTRQYCEVAGRSLPTLCDAHAALADIGFNMNSLLEYVRRPKRVTFGDAHKSVPTTTPNVLLVGERKNFPSYIPENSKFPKFPDPHTYVRTLTGQEPEGKYGILRERSSSQRWDVERALTRFMAKTGSSHPLLSDDKNAFPLIAAIPSPIPYLTALLPSEHENLTKAPSTNTGHESTSESEVEQYEGEETPGRDRASKRKHHHRKADPSQGSPTKISRPKSHEKTEMIDSPYLRPAKTPKLKKRPR